MDTFVEESLLNRSPPESFHRKLRKERKKEIRKRGGEGKRERNRQEKGDF